MTPAITKAILVGVKLKDESRREAESSIEELRRLAETAGVEALCETIQPKDAPDPTYFIGRGKVEELKALAAELKAEAVIFDNNLTPAQTRNLEKTLDAMVIDRTSLILQIFMQRAQTREAKLQVDLAQLQYALPRLTRMWSHLSRLATGAGGATSVGAGRAGGAVRGPGETQLQTDRRLIREQISRVKKALEKVEKRRRVQRSHRQDMIKASLVGYTNAGKSTLFNLMASERRVAEDKLFATLDPTTRLVELPENKRILLSDTVGFIRKLPHDLVAAFKATLEEVAEADLILHIVDASHPQAEQQIAVVNEALEELGASKLPTIMVLNKIDLPEAQEQLGFLQSQYPDSVAISARDGSGIDALKACIAARFPVHNANLLLTLSYQDGKALDYLYKHGEVINAEYQSDAIQVKAKISSRYLKTLDELTPHSRYIKN
jgi:GTP-binding protein HflX